MGHNLSIHKKTHQEVPADPMPAATDPQTGNSHPVEEASQIPAAEAKKELAEYEVKILVHFNKVQIGSSFYDFRELKEMITSKTREEQDKIIENLLQKILSSPIGIRAQDIEISDISNMLSAIYEFIDIGNPPPSFTPCIEKMMAPRVSRAVRTSRSICPFNLNIPVTCMMYERLDLATPRISTPLGSYGTRLQVLQSLIEDENHIMTDDEVIKYCHFIGFFLSDKAKYKLTKDSLRFLTQYFIKRATDDQLDLLSHINNKEDQSQYIIEKFESYCNPKKIYEATVRQTVNNKLSIKRLEISSEDFIILGIDAILEIIREENSKRAKKAQG